MSGANKDQRNAFVRYWVSKNMPSAEELETAARVCIKLADACENSMSWWQRIFYSASEVRNIGRKCAEAAIRLRSWTINTPNTAAIHNPPTQGQPNATQTNLITI